MWGVENDESYQRWEVAFLPCNYIHSEIGSTNDTVHEECLPDREKQMEYIGNFNVVIYVSEAHFLKDEYGARSIEREV